MYQTGKNAAHAANIAAIFGRNRPFSPDFYHIFTFFDPGGLTSGDPSKKTGQKMNKKSPFYRVGVFFGRTLESPESPESPESRESPDSSEAAENYPLTAPHRCQDNQMGRS